MAVQSLAKATRHQVHRPESQSIEQLFAASREIWLIISKGSLVCFACSANISCYNYKFPLGFLNISCNASSENLDANQTNVPTYWRILLEVDHTKQLKGYCLFF